MKLRTPTDLRKEMRPPRGRAEVPRTWPAGFASTDHDRAAVAVLAGLPSLVPSRLLDLAAEAGTATECLREVRRGRAASERDVAAARAADPAAVMRAVVEAGARLVVVGDDEYPLELLDLHDPPAALFLRGRDLRSPPTRVAIVGSRTCSAAGQEMATVLGRAAAAAGASVVSGGARGIDVAAHRGALSVGGPSVAVLGCGIDVDYPRRHREVFAALSRNGSVVSEYPPGTRAEPFRFPARNRIIAALSRAVVVVEGAAGSGSMITADHALELGRDVFAVPGAVASELSQVPLVLLRDGAGLVRGPDDLFGDLGLGPAEPAATEGATTSAPLLWDVRPAVREAWEALVDTAPAEVLATRTGRTIGEVVAALAELELRGVVRRVGGRYERRAVVDRT